MHVAKRTYCKTMDQLNPFTMSVKKDELSTDKEIKEFSKVLNN